MVLAVASCHPPQPINNKKPKGHWEKTICNRSSFQTKKRRGKGHGPMESTGKRRVSTGRQMVACNRMPATIVKKAFMRCCIRAIIALGRLQRTKPGNYAERIWNKP